tara:strand:+ start:451 stop:645 length:195 start_codon:yes stop_codon:yes gene_type:complete
MMCGGGGIAKMTEDIYQKEKKDYGDLPSLAVGDKVERRSGRERMKDVKKPAASAARSLLMPFMK